MRDTKRLEAAIRRLLGCPALNLDDLEEEDRAAIREAQSLLVELGVRPYRARLRLRLRPRLDRTP